MAITLISSPGRVDNATLWEVSTSLSEDASHVNLRIDAEVYIKGVVAFVKTQPKGALIFNFKKIFDSIIKPYRETVGGSELVKMGGPGTGYENLITEWTDLNSNHEIFDVSGNAITQAADTNGSDAWAASNTFSVTIGDILVLSFQNFNNTGTNWVLAKIEGEDTYTRIENAINHYIFFPFTTNANCRLLIGRSIGNFNYGCGQWIRVYKIPTSEIAKDKMIHYAMKFTEKWEDANGVTQTGGVLYDRFKSYVKSNATTLSTYTCDGTTRKFLQTCPSTIAYKTGAEIQLNFLQYKYGCLIRAGIKKDGGTIVYYAAYMGGFLGIIMVNDITAFTTGVNYVEVAIYKYNFSEFLYSSLTLAHPVYAIGPEGSRTPGAWYYNKKTYGAWMKRKGAGYNVDSMIFAYYHETGVISDSYLCNTGIEGGQDPHAYPAVIVANDGHIIVAREKLLSTSETAGHNSSMYINRSDNVEDETSWVNALAHDPDYWSQIGDDSSYRLCYPQLVKITGGNLFLFARDIVHAIRIYKSTDNGISWDGFGTGEGPGLVVMQDFPAYYMLYLTQPKHKTDSKIYMIVNPYNDDTGKKIREELYYLWSYDGITWWNVAGTWSKNIVSSGAISKTEADTNLKVCGESDKRYYHTSSFIDSSGRPHILLIRSDDGATWWLAYYYWNGAAWISNNLSIPNLYQSKNALIYQRYGTNYVTLVAPVDNGVNKLYAVYYSTDYITWTFSKYIDIENDTNINCSFTFNYPDADYNLFYCLVEVDPDYSDIYIVGETPQVRLSEWLRINKLTDSCNAIELEWLGAIGGLETYVFRLDYIKSHETEREYYQDEDRKKKALQIYSRNSKMVESFNLSQSMLEYLQGILDSLFVSEMSTSRTEVTVTTDKLAVRRKGNILTGEIDYEY